MTSSRVRLTARQDAILSVIVASPECLSTSDIRKRINQLRVTPLVAEQVYRASQSLWQRGLIRRVEITGTSKAYWQAVGAYFTVKGLK